MNVSDELAKHPRAAPLPLAFFISYLFIVYTNIYLFVSGLERLRPTNCDRKHFVTEILTLLYH